MYTIDEHGVEWPQDVPPVGSGTELLAADKAGPAATVPSVGVAFSVNVVSSLPLRFRDPVGSGDGVWRCSGSGRAVIGLSSSDLRPAVGSVGATAPVSDKAGTAGMVRRRQWKR